MESLILETMLQLGLQVVTELNVVMFILACWMWPLAIWGALIFDY